jgi:signal transduction histidine kinase/DNA-binding response OmpR family regulator
MSDFLIVCCREKLRDQLTSLLGDAGYSTATAPDASTGQELWLREKHPVLLLDQETLSTAGMAWLSEQTDSSRLLLLQDDDSGELASRYLYSRLSGIVQLPLQKEQLLALSGSALQLARAALSIEQRTDSTPSTEVPSGEATHYDQELVDIILNAKREWQSIFDSFQELMLVVDKEGQVHRLNLAVQQIYNEPFVKLIGTGISTELYDVITRSDHDSPRPLNDFKLLDRSPLIPGLWEFSSLPLRISGEKETILLSGRDVTERERMRARQKQMELELMHEARLSSVGMLASGLAHNMSTPVQCILGYSRMLHREYPDDDRLDRLEEMSQNLKQIIENLMLKLRRDQTTEVSLINLNTLLQDDLKFLEADLYYKHQIEKDFQFASKLSAVPGGHGDFSQAILNIISNAVDAMFERPKRVLTIRTSLQSDKVLLEISDTGCGMTSEIRENIFSPFFTTKPTREERQGEEPVGTGLGLASTRNLLEKYKVIIKVDSTPDEGSCFRLLFPIAI